MVKFWCFFYCLIHFLVLYADVQVDSTINQNRGHLHFPLNGTITITMDQGGVIDPLSFEIEGKKLDTSLVKNVSLSGTTTIAIYSFVLPPQEVGLYQLPAISVTVNGKKYQSLATNYSVVSSEPNSTSAPSKEAALLQLQAFIKGNSKLYPGERTTLVYRISFNRSIDLTKSDLPFIHPQGFIKIGDAEINEQQQGALTVQEISQVIEATTTIGNYSIGPSFVEGYAYQTNFIGKKEYENQLLHAEAPAVLIEVGLFTKTNQPASFNGALGKITGKISLLSSTIVHVGETVQLALTITGLSNLSEYQLPPLECQPGFSGIFYYDSLNTQTEIKDSSKTFYFELRILNALAFEIPTIELSSFDSYTKNYYRIYTPALPLELVASKLDGLSIELSEQKEPTFNQIEKLFAQTSIDFIGIRQDYLNPTQNSFFQEFWLLFLIPLSVFFLLFQFWLHRKWLKYIKTNKVQSYRYLKEAQQNKSLPLIAAKALEKALVWRLIELKFLDNFEFDMKSLEANQNLRKFHSLLHQLQAFQYGKREKINLNQLFIEVKNLLT